MPEHSHPISRHHAVLAGVSLLLFGVCMLVSRVQAELGSASPDVRTFMFELFGGLSSIAAGAALVADARATRSRLRVWAVGGLAAVALLPARWLWVMIPVAVQQDSPGAELVSRLSFGGFVYNGALISAILLLMLLWRTREVAWTAEAR